MRSLSAAVFITLFTLQGNSVALYAQSDPFPIMSWAAPNGKTPTLSQLQDMKDAGFNIWMEAEPSTGSMDDAGSIGMKTIVGLSWKPYVHGQRLFERAAYETDSNSGINNLNISNDVTYFNFSGTVGDHFWFDPDAANDRASFADVDSFPAGKIIELMAWPFYRYMKPRHSFVDPDSDGKLDFQVTFYLKTTVGWYPLKSVCTIKVVKGSTTLASMSFTTEEFPDPPVSSYTPKTLTYQLNVGDTGGDMKFVVDWDGLVDLYVDRITGFDEAWTALDNGSYNTDMDAVVSTYATGGREDYLKFWYLKDEPDIPDLWANKTVSDYLETASSRSGIQAIQYPHAAKEAALLYSESGSVDAMMFDHYPFFVNTSSVSETSCPVQVPETDGLQETLDAFLTQAKLYYDETIGNQGANVTEYWGYVQAHGWYRGDPEFEVIKRFPSPYEITLQAYLYLAYGAKGLVYFRTVSNPDTLTPADWALLLPSPSPQGMPCINKFQNCNPPDDKIRGLSYFENGIWTKDNPQWNTVSDLNADIQLIGDVIRELTWVDAYTAPCDTSGSNVVQNVTSSYSPAYIEVSEFSHPSGDKYFMLVNRRVQASETQTLTVTLETGAKRLIEDVLASREPWDNDPNRVAYRILESGVNTFTLKLKPGEGRLFRISTAGLSGAVDEDRYWSGEVLGRRELHYK
ncbi:MAG: hypothetical protein IIB41_05520 [Candidatus Marinimicrobia bacterium]|nr:hypothetical protein [Candidatus Neomarinimicrobiota bacterium]